MMRNHLKNRPIATLVMAAAAAAAAADGHGNAGLSDSFFLIEILRGKPEEKKEKKRRRKVVFHRNKRTAHTHREKERKCRF